MDPNHTKSRSRRAFSSFVRAMMTYVSPFTVLVGPTLALFGVGIDPRWNWWIALVFVLPLAGIGWLINEYRLALRKIEEEGHVQSPEWLWTFLTNRVTHSREQISSGAQVMVLVPPGKETEATKLARIYNHQSKEPVCEGQHNLLFHYVPRGGESKSDNPKEEEVERLKDLSSNLGNCAAVVLLDDSEWEKEYPLTLKVINEWSLENTERAVVSLHLNGTGHLRFNWCLLEAVTSDNHLALHTRLLAQATIRGFKWYHQAQVYRWFAFRLALAALVVFIAAILAIYWGTTQRREADKHRTSLYNLLVVGGNGSEQVDAAKTMATFRQSKNDWPARKELLNATAHQIKDVVTQNSGVKDVSVSMFSAKVEGGLLSVKEVAASRKGFTKSPYDFDKPTPIMQPYQEGLVKCAIVEGAFFFWAGDSKQKKTTDIKAWDLQGSAIGQHYNPQTETLSTVLHMCKYQFPQPPAHSGETDVPQMRLICAPAGSTFNAREPVNGAICISVPHEVDWLSEPWVRFTLLRFGNALSFMNWVEPDENSPSKNVPSTK